VRATFRERLKPLKRRNRRIGPRQIEENAAKKNRPKAVGKSLVLPASGRDANHS